MKNDHFKLYHTDKALSPHMKNWGRIESSFKPSPKDIELAQIKLGYDPKGYGGPDCIDIKVVGVKWVTTWSWGYSCE